MTLRNFLSINGILFIPFGLMMVLIPTILFPILNVILDGDGLVMARTVGSMLLSFGLICWFARDVQEDNYLLQAIIIGNFTFHTIDSFLTGQAAFNGTMNEIGFVFSTMHFVLAVGFAYYLRKFYNKNRHTLVTE